MPAEERRASRVGEDTTTASRAKYSARCVEFSVGRFVTSPTFVHCVCPPMATIVLSRFASDFVNEQLMSGCKRQ